MSTEISEAELPVTNLEDSNSDLLPAANQPIVAEATNLSGSFSEQKAVSAEEDWTTVITPHRGLLNIPWKELWEYRGLIGLLVHRDYVATYKQTLLGSVWHLLQPLLQTLMFVLVFSRILRIPTNGVPPILFFLSGLVCWRYFADCVTKTSTIFTSNQAIFDKIYFPRLAVPIAQVIVNLIGFLMQLLMFIGLYIFFVFNGVEVRPDWRLIILPVLIFELAAIGLGVGCLISALTNRYRDLAMSVGFLMQLWMYASCVVFPLSQVAPSARPIIELNPIVPIIEAFRYAFFGMEAGTVVFPQILHGAIISIIVLVVGIIVFNKVERTSVDDA